MSTCPVCGGVMRTYYYPPSSPGVDYCPECEHDEDSYDEAEMAAQTWRALLDMCSEEDDT